MDELHNIGLRVIVTVCDQHLTNCSAILNLKKETDFNFKRNDIENWFVGFSVIDGEEVVPPFNVPHLLKGLRNNLLKYDAYFLMNGQAKIASWRHIQKLYEFDIVDQNTRMLNKVTDHHIYRDQMQKLKVKNAAQIFSHRVETTMPWTLKYDKSLSFTYKA